MFILYHPIVNRVSKYPGRYDSFDWYSDDQGWTGPITSASFSVWMVPGTIDPNEE